MLANSCSLVVGLSIYLSSIYLARYAHLFQAQTMLAFMWLEDGVSVARFIREALSILTFDAADAAATDASASLDVAGTDISFHSFII